MGSRGAQAGRRFVIVLGLVLAAAASARAQPHRDALVDTLVREAWRDYKAKGYHQARMKLQTGVLLSPDRADVHFELAETLFWLGRHDEALLHFERTLQLEPTMSTAYHGFGQSCLALAADERIDPYLRERLLVIAERAFRITLLLTPDYASAKKALQRLPDVRNHPYPLGWLEELIALLVFLLCVEAGYRCRHVLLRPASWRAGLRAWRWPLLLFVTSRALVIGAFALAPLLVPEAREHPKQLFHHWHPVLDAAAGRWDSNIYFDIAEHGYRMRVAVSSEAWSSVGSFPLLPGLQRSLAGTIGSPHVSALLLPNLALLAATLFLYALFRRQHGERIAVGATAVLLLHPGSLYGSVLYSEPVALLGLAGLLYAVEREASPLETLLWGLFAGLARLSSLAIVPWLLYEALQRRGRERRLRVLAACAPLAGVGVFMLYLQLKVGDALAYFRELHDVRFAERGPLVALYEAGELFTHLLDLSRPLGGPWPVLLLALSCMAAYLLVMRALWRARAWGPLSFIACGSALALTSSLAAQPRYLWILFAAAPAIANALDRPRLRWIAPALAGLVLTLAALYFARWHYVT